MNLKCSECGKTETGTFFESVEKKLEEKKLCFSCNHWQELVDIGNGPNGASCVRVKHVHYMIGADDGTPTRWRGFGGDFFHIKFHDGREAKSTNMWCQGHIPPHFHDRLPDNAEFVKAFAYQPSPH